MGSQDLGGGRCGAEERLGGPLHRLAQGIPIRRGQVVKECRATICVETDDPGLFVPQEDARHRVMRVVLHVGGEERREEQAELRGLDKDPLD